MKHDFVYNSSSNQQLRQQPPVWGPIISVGYVAVIGRVCVTENVLLVTGFEPASSTAILMLRKTLV